MKNLSPSRLHNLDLDIVASQTWQDIPKNMKKLQLGDTTGNLRGLPWAFLEMGDPPVAMGTPILAWLKLDDLGVPNF